MTDGSPEQRVEDLLALIERHDRDAFVSALRNVAVDDGFPAAAHLLADIQEEVGRRWQTRAWSVADEHAATAAVDQALAAVASVTAPTGASAGRILVVCAEEEWHVLPSRLFAEELRHRGWDAVFLGGSIPAEHLGHYLDAHPVTAVAVSASIAMHLPGAARVIATCHDQGVPVLVGGAAFGRSAARAHALGADGWAANAEDAAAQLSAIDGRPLASPAVDPAAQLALEAERGSIVDAAMVLLAERFPPMIDFDEAQVKRTREDFDYIVRFVGATLLVDDPGVFTDFLGWLSDILDAVGLPQAVLPLSLTVVHDSLPAGHREAAAIVSEGRRHVLAARDLA